MAKFKLNCLQKTYFSGLRYTPLEYLTIKRILIIILLIFNFPFLQLVVNNSQI